MATNLIDRPPLNVLKAFLIACAFLPASVLASVPTDKLFDSAIIRSAAVNPAVTGEFDYIETPFRVAQYTDHSMRFEQPGPTGRETPVETPKVKQSGSGGQSGPADSSSVAKPAPPRQNFSANVSSTQTTPVDSYGSIDGINELYEEEADPFAEDGRVVPELKDPFFSFNHAIYEFNEALYKNILEPVVEFYVEYIHEDVRIAIRNLFRNALAPARFVNSLLQGKFEKAGKVLSRTVINTVFGLGGMLDVAGQEYNIKPVNEDFGQTLGFYGVPSGPYIVLPFLGPSTVRDAFGRGVDSLMSPAVIFSPGLIGGFALSGSEMVNEVSFSLEGKRQLELGAIDQYESIRDFYHQYREGLIYR